MAIKEHKNTLNYRFHTDLNGLTLNYNTVIELLNSNEINYKLDGVNLYVFYYHCEKASELLKPYHLV